MPTLFKIPVENHDSHICAHLGAELGQKPGGWSIGHSYEGDDVTLSFPEEIKEEQIAAAIATYEPPKPVPAAQVTLLSVTELEEQVDAITTLTEAKAVLQKWAQGLGGRIPKA